MNQTIENFIKNIELDEAISLCKQYLNVHFNNDELIKAFPIIKSRYKEYFDILRRDRFLYDIQSNTSKETFRKLLICVDRAKILLKGKK